MYIIQASDHRPYPFTYNQSRSRESNSDRMQRSRSECNIILALRSSNYNATWTIKKKCGLHIFAIYLLKKKKQANK